MSSDSSLEQVLGTERASAFRSAFWPGRPFHAQVDPSAWPAWLHSELLKQPAALDAVYRGRVDVTRGNRAQYRVEGAPVSRWVEDLGLTVRLSELERHLSGAREWLRALELELGIPAGACELNAFINAPGVGLSAHCDPYEHLLIHVTGSKRIRLKPSPALSYFSASHSLVYTPTPREAAQRAQGFDGWGRELPSDAEQLALTPGSVVFMPRGCYHETRGGDDGISVSLVVRMIIPSYADLWADYLRDYLLQNAAWRTPAAGAWGHEERARAAHHDMLATLVRAASSQLTELQYERMFDHRSESRGAASIAPQARFVRNPAVLVEVDRAQGRIRVQSELGLGATFEAPLSVPALELVSAINARRAPFSFAELRALHAAWEETALVTVVRFLQRREVLIALQVEPYRETSSLARPA